MTATAKQVSFSVTDSERGIIRQIVARAVKAKLYPVSKRLDARMDIEATHANGNPLRLADLLAADNFNFAHDVAGIRNRLDRETGKLLGFFVPRFTLSEGWKADGATSTTITPRRSAPVVSSTEAL